MKREAREKDVFFMHEALKEAGKARARGEVPIGAVVVYEGKVIARGYNKKEAALDATSHAEITAIARASRKLGNWRLAGTTLYVTLEPCLMCMGAIVQARIPRLVFGAFDPKAGACGSLYDISKDTRLNHRVHVRTGVCEEEAGEILKGFFKKLRKEKKTGGSSL